MALFSASLAIHTLYMYDGHHMKDLCYKCSYLEGLGGCFGGRKAPAISPRAFGENSLHVFFVISFIGCAKSSFESWHLAQLISSSKWSVFVCRGTLFGRLPLFVT